MPNQTAVYCQVSDAGRVDRNGCVGEWELRLVNTRKQASLVSAIQSSLDSKVQVLCVFRKPNVGGGSTAFKGNFVWLLLVCTLN